MDTSVLISAVLSDHAHHSQSHAWLEHAKSAAVDFVVSGHSVAEMYSVLTRLPRRPRITPEDAAKLVEENVVRHADIIPLTGHDYVALIAELAHAGVTGGAVYDGVIAKAAALAGVDHLLTLNVTHFQHVWPSMAKCVVSPLSIPLP